MSEIKKNWALIVGLLLPILMVGVFYVVPYITGIFVAPPQYDFLYSSKDYSYGDAVLIKDFKIMNDFLIVKIKNSYNHPQKIPSIYRFEVKTMRSYPIHFTDLDELLPHEQKEFILKGISIKEFNQSTTAPDGYEIKKPDNFNFLGGLFFSQQNSFLFAISKNGRVIPIKKTLRTSYYSTNFLGWLIP